MSWIPFLEVIVGAAVVTAFTDWLSMGDLFHARHHHATDIWREGPGELRKILMSEALGLVSIVALTCLCVRLGATTILSAETVAILAWIAGPATLIATNTVWIRMHPGLAASHAIGWLVRFAVTAGLVGLLL